METISNAIFFKYSVLNAAVMSSLLIYTRAKIYYLYIYSIVYNGHSLYIIYFHGTLSAAYIIASDSYIFFSCYYFLRVETIVHMPIDNTTQQ